MPLTVYSTSANDGDASSAASSGTEQIFEYLLISMLAKSGAPGPAGGFTMEIVCRVRPQYLLAFRLIASCQTTA